MKRDQIVIVLAAIVFGLAILLGIGTRDAEEDFLSSFMNTSSVDSKAPFEQAFADSGLITNTEKTSINLSHVLGGGPRKDGIPALTNPTFVSIDRAPRSVTDDVAGILVSRNGEAKFYPYNILVWHEIVNDEVGGEPVVVTFCPLCGSAIVFDPHVHGEELGFGVSGKLYESNLLMYDQKTESLWSQILGEAVVGEFTGTKLELGAFQVLTFEEVKEKYPNAQVLSDDTGYSRNYSVYPYGDYDDNQELYFPVTVSDQRFSLKEIMYASVVGDVPIAFPLEKLESLGEATLNVDGETVRAVAKNGEVELFDESGALLPGYHAMWFSWATHNKEGGVVWQP